MYTVPGSDIVRVDIDASVVAGASGPKYTHRASPAPATPAEKEPVPAPKKE
jgi:hypothetical protein